MIQTDEPHDEVRNLRHWSGLFHTDPKHTKPFQRSGGFRGTATKPIWNQYRLTEHFGPYGIGWGTEKPDFEMVKTEDEILVFCTLRCWYMDDNGQRAEIFGVGGDKVVAKQQRGPVSDDEAFKKAFTDALGNAFVKVGLSADVHMGMFEDSKYVAEARQHFAAEAAPPPVPQQQPRMNGHAKAPPPPPPIEPPHHPETGEVAPHKITLTTANTGLPNWIDFGGKIVAAYNSASSIGDLAEWEALNIDTLNKMATAAPKAHALVMKRRNENKDRLTAEPDMVSAEETGSLLQ